MVVSKFHCMQAEAGRPAEAAALHREALLENPDDWGSLQAYLDCRLPGSAAEPQPSPPPAGAAVQRLSDSAAELHIGGGQEGLDAEVQCLCVLCVGMAVTRTDPCNVVNEDRGKKHRSKPGTGCTLVQALLEEAQLLVEELATRGESAQLRGPALAPAELQLRRLRVARCGGGAPSDTQPLAEAICAVFPRLSASLSCATDLR